METSNVLTIRPDLVDMRKAVNDSSMMGKSGNMTPVPVEGGNLNTSGVNGYAALAMPEKGRKSMAAFAKELIREVDSDSTCVLPKMKDRSTEYKLDEGKYLNGSGKEMVLYQKDGKLYFTWDGKDSRNFFPLYKDAPDYFSSMNLNLLFIKNESDKVTKAWCQYRGESFWVTKTN